MAKVIQSQLFSVATRILGVYLLMQAVLQVPDGIVESVSLLVLWISQNRTALGTGVGMYFPHAVSALLGFMLFAVAGMYLVRGAPLLFRLAGIVEDTQEQTIQ